MKLILPILSTFLLSAFTVIHAQTKEEYDNATSYRLELSGTVSTGDLAPFWITSHKYGLMPTDANNGYLRAGIFHNQPINHSFSWEAGIDIAAVLPRYKNVYIHQLFAELNYKCLRLSIGSKEKYNSLWDKNLSSGDMVLSTNAHPIPEINLSIPDFTVIPKTKGWLQLKGDFAFGKSFDKGFLEDFANDKAEYIYNPLWHHKSFYLRGMDTQGDFPLSATVGIQHWAAWGGTSNNPNIGEQPHSFKDFLRIIMGKEGNENATNSDQINVLGNHFGSYDFQLTYRVKDKGQLSLYHQHYFEDKSGMIFDNKTDGLWGIDLKNSIVKWLSHITLEHLITKDQTGPFHFITYDHNLYHGTGGGGDDYYNNGEYTTGSSYFGMALGSPLLTSPVYNENGEVSFLNTRVRAWHFAFEGEISSLLSYRLKYTRIHGWGTPLKPFTSIRRSHSAQVEIQYIHPKLKGWTFNGILGGDHGTLYGNNFGFNITVSKRGILKRWE